MTVTGTPDSDERGRRVWQHAVFYSWLVVASVGPLSDRIGAGEGVLLPLVLITVLAAWYAAWMVWAKPLAGRAAVGYLAGAGAVWVSLLLVDGSFLLLGTMVFAPHCLESRRFGLAVLGLGVGGWIWQRWAATGAVAWQEIVIALLIGLVGVASVGYVSSHVRVSAERKRLLDELHAAQDAQAAAQRRAGIADERQRLARDIHDTLTQGFASIAMLLEAAEETTPTSAPARRHVSQALRTARDSLADSRRVVWALRPEQLDHTELPEALRQLAERLSEETGLRVDTAVTGTPLPLCPDAQTALLRVAQEALANVRRHANAQHANLTLSYMGDAVTLDVHDDGIGFDHEHSGSAAGVGLRGMRERLDHLGGTLLVETAPGQGTTLVASLPATAPATSPPTEATAGLSR